MTGGVGFGVFSVGGDSPRVGFRVGHDVLDLAAHGLGQVFGAPTLNPFLALGRTSWEDTIARIDELVRAGADLVPLEDADIGLPFTVGDYVDFYSSLEHATNLGRLFRPDTEPLLPNWRHLPVGYHGRAGTIVVSGTPIVRPCGQAKSPTEDVPHFGPSRRLDIELEIGFVVGVGSRLGEPVRTAEFRDHVFGVVLVNDWSARDIQAWSTSRSVRSSESLSRRPSGHGSRRWRCSRTGSCRLRSRIPIRCRTFGPRAIGLSTSSSRSSSAAPSSRARTHAASTGRCRSSSRMRR